jgi:putative phosphoribosyl transferase
MPFTDRSDAGRRLGAALGRYRQEQPVILGLPRGGVVVGYEVALALDAPLDVLVVRKLGAPGAEEFAIGALAPGATILDREVVASFGISQDYIAREVARQERELARRDAAYRGDRPPPDVAGRTAILVDDGLATGATARAAVASLRQRQPGRVVFAAPVCSLEGAETLRRIADDVVCLECPSDFRAVGIWYNDFRPTTDAEVVECLRQASARRIGV